MGRRANRRGVHARIMSACRMRQKNVESFLQRLETLQSSGIRPDAWKLEQYTTPPHIAASILTYIQTYYGDIEGKRVTDLGCGCGVLSIGCALLGATQVIGVDIDKCSIDVMIENVKAMELEGVVATKQADITNLNASDIPVEHVDVVIMNPPFGTKLNNGIDRVFIEKALKIVPVVYSLHKSTTRDYWVQKVSKDLSCTVSPLMSVLFNIDSQFKFHRKESKDIEVDLLKFERKITS